MNECFLIGKIISNIEYKFIYKNSKANKNTAIAYFDIELSNKSIVKVKAFNEIADYCYKNLENKNNNKNNSKKNNKKQSIVLINGRIETNGNINILNIFNIN